MSTTGIRGRAVSAGGRNAEAKRGAALSVRENLALFAIVAIAFAAMMLVAIPGSLITMRESEALAKQLSELPDAFGQPAGTKAVLTGVIAADTQPLHRHFVAFVEERFYSGGKYSRRHWDIESGRIQRFKVVDGVRGMWIAKPGYRFSPVTDPRSWSFLVTRKAVVPDWDHVPAWDGETPGGATHEKRLRGFVAGGPVTVIGTVTEGGEIDADFVLGESRDEIITRLRATVDGEPTSLLYFFIAMGIAGLVMSIVVLVGANVSAARSSRRG
ncbi:MAG: hypothetical protein KDJ37_13535 [Hyphomicrobiaceae bacterium]|nr:hypothetical protein [Hyphomicrobiaceae bacterium]